MNQLRQTIERAAKANSRILIVGPSGAGKELAARTLHNASGRAEGPFVVINAAAITPERMEVELFGIEQSNGEQSRKAVRWKRRMAERSLSTNRRHAARNPEQDSAGAGRSDVPAVRGDLQGQRRRSHHLLHGAKSGRGDRRGAIPRRSLSSAFRGADSACRRCRSAARHPELIDYFMDQISVATGLPKRQIARMRWPVLQSHVWPGNVRQLRNNVERS